MPSKDDFPLSTEELDNFKRGFKTEACFLHSWVYVEYHIHQAFLKHFEFAKDNSLKCSAIFGNDARKVSFGRKLNALRKLKLFSNKEAHDIVKFQTDRNVMFHDRGALWYASNSEEEDIKENFDSVINAVTAVNEFQKRNYQPPISSSKL